MIRAALYEYLSSHPVVAAVVGGRVYAQVVPRKAWSDGGIQPCVVYTVVAVERSSDRCSTVNLQRTSVQLDAYSVTAEGAAAVAAALRAALLDYRGPMGGPPSLVSVRAVTLDTEFDIVDPEPGLFRISLTFGIWHTDLGAV